MPIIWKELEDYPGYEVSSQGEVRRAYHADGGIKYKTLKPYSLKHYLVVSPSVDGKQQKAYVHTLVCEAFHGPKPDDDYRAVLIDPDKPPTMANVKWMTRQDVSEWRAKKGLPALGGKPKGTKAAPKKAAAAKAKPMPKTEPKAKKQTKAARKK